VRLQVDVPAQLEQALEQRSIRVFHIANPAAEQSSIRERPFQVPRLRRLGQHVPRQRRHQIAQPSHPCVPLGPDLADGVFVAHDGDNDGANGTNFKLVPWGSIADATGGLIVDPNE
jgi:hypothetical protein